MLEELSWRDREIIKLHYGLGDGYAYTLDEIGKTFAISRERVRQIEVRGTRLQATDKRHCATGRLRIGWPQSARYMPIFTGGRTTIATSYV